VAGGYDGFLGLLAEQESVDLQTHNASLRATYDLDRVRLDLRYDFAYTWLELDGPFRELHRLTASATAPEGDWGLAQFYAQANHSDFKPTAQSSELNRDGFRYSAGFNQWIYTDLGPVRYLRVGATGDFYDADGHDFSYNAVEASSGLGLSLPMEVRGAFLYRYVRRFYNKRSSSSAMPGFKRDDNIHSLSLDLSKEIGEHWLLSVSGSAILNRSDDDFFDYDRFVAGIYVSYRF
jgi:hypothetical protein